MVAIERVIGIDIGGTKLSVAGFDANKLQATDKAYVQEALQRLAIAETPKTEGSFINRIAELIDHARGDVPANQCLVGISTAGIANPDTGEILGSTGNLPAVGYHPFPLGTAVASKLGVPLVHVENDANAAAYGECRLGAALGHQNVVMITLGTGVGGGMIVNGQLLRGSHFSAGEVGHIRISLTNDRQCTCNRIGCWEIYASGTGLAMTAKRDVSEMPNSPEALDLLQGKPIEELTTHALVAAYQRGNRLAEGLMDKWHFHIATGLGGVMNILDPDIAVIGGGMAQFVELKRLKHYLDVRAMEVMQNTPIVKAQLGNKAGMIGAAYLALEQAPQQALLVV
jgi:glucokinase